MPGTQPFRVYGYGTTDPLEEVLRQDYFAAARALLRPGELICVSAAAPRLDVGGSARGEARLALVMVRGQGRRPGQADGSARLAPWAQPPRSARSSAGAGLRPPERSVGRARLAGATAAGCRAGAGQARAGPPARQPDQESRPDAQPWP